MSATGRARLGCADKELIGIFAVSFVWGSVAVYWVGEHGVMARRGDVCVG